MGCFLACFGVSKKKRKHSKRALIKDIKKGSYAPLESSAPLNLNVTKNPVGSELQFREKPKSQLKSKIRKKVSFNLNVQVYEPIYMDYRLLKNDTEEEYDESIEKTEKRDASGSSPFEGRNYRYQNWLDGYEEDDDIAYEDDDLDDEYSDEDSVNGSDADDGKSESLVSCGNTSKYEHSVLSPIENLTQWKAAKARTKASPKPQRKENIAVEKELPLHLSKISNSKISMFGAVSKVNQSKLITNDVAVNASVCNWLARPYSNQIMSLDDKSKTGVEGILSKKSSMGESNLLRYREHSPNLDITDWEI